VPSPTPAVVEFAVRPPVWLRPWFFATAAALAALSAYVWHRARLTRMLELERVRLRIAVDLHDDIGASLSQIAILSEVARRQASGAGVDEPLARVAATSREVVDAMNDIVWAINPQRDSLGDLTSRIRRFASDVLASRGVRLRFAAPHGPGPRLDHDVRRELLLMLKESITNVARHADASEVSVEIALSGEWLTLAVRDNGRGFDANAIEPGHGVASIRRRVESLGGTVAIDSSPGAGTDIIAVVPFPPRVRMDYLSR